MSDPIVVPTISKSRHRGHLPYNQLVKDDGLKYVRMHPDNFEALLYLPATVDAPAPVDDWLGGDDFSRPDVNQTVLAYQDPIAISVLEQPRQQVPYDVDQSGDDQISEVEEFLIVNLDVDGVPVGAALEWLDAISETEDRRSWWYVHHISSLGSTKAGATYYLIPLKDFTGLAI